jgi:hypothetical protein
MLLDADVQAGIVVDRTGAVIGLVTADMVAEWMRETAVEPDFAVAPEASGPESPPEPSAIEA